MSNVNSAVKVFIVTLSLFSLVACGSTATTAPSPTQPTTQPVAQPTTSSVQPTVVRPAPTSAPAETTATSQPTRAAQATQPAPTTAPSQPTAASQPTRAAQATQSAAPTIKKINLNTATAEQILTVPNAGQRMVREFQEYRPYTSILQFRREIGKYVDAAQVAAYEKYVYVPVVPNRADAATLQQLPGVDLAVAEKLIAARPYANKDAFLKKLAEFVTAEQAAAASDMVEAP